MWQYQAQIKKMNQPWKETMKRNYSLSLLFRSALVLVIGCGSLFPGNARAQTWTVVMTGLHNPRGIAFAPDGALYVAESGCGGNTSNCEIPPNPSDPSAPCVKTSLG